MASISPAKRASSGASMEPDTSTITASRATALAVLKPGSQGMRQPLPVREALAERARPWLAR
jgi:hypothetical protein